MRKITLTDEQINDICNHFSKRSEDLTDEQISELLDDIISEARIAKQDE